MRRTLYHLKALMRDQRGAALLEMTVVFPVLLTLGLGVIEFSNAIYNYHLIANGVRDAARYGAGLPGDVCTSTTLQTAIKNIAMTGQSSSGGQYRVSWWNDPAEVTLSCKNITNTSNAYRGPATIHTLVVASSVTYGSLGFLGFFGLTTPTLVFAHEERVIGVR